MHLIFFLLLKFFFQLLVIFSLSLFISVPVAYFLFLFYYFPSHTFFIHSFTSPPQFFSPFSQIFLFIYHPFYLSLYLSAVFLLSRTFFIFSLNKSLEAIQLSATSFLFLRLVWTSFIVPSSQKQFSIWLQFKKDIISSD